jgi:PKD repeat protein
MTCQEIHIGTPPPNCENTITYTSNFLTVSFEGHTNSIFSTTYSWNMGDPASTNLTGKNVTFTYPAQGSYTVTLVTVDSTGCQWTRTQEIYVHGTCDLYGYVWAGDHYVDHGFIQLIRIDSGNVMTVVDSKLFGDSLGMYQFGLVGPGHYYIKAELTDASQFYGDFVPTYFEHAVNWAEANIIGLGQPNNPYNIHLVHAGGDNPGQGNINGIITQGTKVNGNGSPVPDVEVLLLDATSQPLAYVKTDNNGQFSFPDIALGSYKIYPEVVGKSTTPAIFTLDNAVPSVNLGFNISQNNISIGINDGYPKFLSGISEIYPDPVSDRGNISITSTQNKSLTLSVYSVTGQMMKEIKANIQKGKNILGFDRSGLSAGCYYMKIQTVDKNSMVKIFTVNR